MRDNPSGKQQHMDIVNYQTNHFGIAFVGATLPQLLVDLQRTGSIHHIHNEQAIHEAEDVICLTVFIAGDETMGELLHIIEDQLILSDFLCIQPYDATESITPIPLLSEPHIINEADMSADLLYEVYAEAAARATHIIQEQIRYSTGLMALISDGVSAHEDENFAFLDRLCEVCNAKAAVAILNAPIYQVIGVNNQTRRHRALQNLDTPLSHRFLFQSFGIADASDFYNIPIHISPELTGELILVGNLMPEVVRSIKPLLYSAGQQILVAVGQQIAERRSLLSEIKNHLMAELIKTQSMDETQTALCTHIEKIPGVQHAIVWQDPQGDPDQNPFIANQNTAESRFADALCQFDEAIDFSDLVGNLDFDNYLSITPNSSNVQQFAALFVDSATEQVIIHRLDSAFLRGYVVILPERHTTLSILDLHTVHDLTTATSQVMQKQLLSNWVDNQLSWLEHAADFISDGIIYINNMGYIDSVNRQFADQTGIPINQLVGQNLSVLQDHLTPLLAEQPKSDRVQPTLIQRIDTAINTNTPLSISLKNPQGTPFLLQIYPIQESPDDPPTLIGITRLSGTATGGGHSNNSHEAGILPRLLSQLSVHHAQVTSLLSVRSRKEYLTDMVMRSQIEDRVIDEIEQLGDMIRDLSALFEPVPAELQDIEVQSAHTLVQNGIAALKDPLHIVKTNLADYSVFNDIEVNADDITRAIERILAFLCASDTTNKQMQIRVDRDMEAVSIHIEHFLIPERAHQLHRALAGNIGDVSSNIDLRDHVSLKLFQAEIERNAGTIIITDGAVRIEFPADEHPQEQHPAPAAPAAESFPQPIAQYDNDYEPFEKILVARNGQKITNNVIEVLRNKGFELNTCNHTDDCLVYLDERSNYDLIVIFTPADRDGFIADIEAVRQKTWAPILVITEHPNRALMDQLMQTGVDGYLQQSVSEDELMARVNLLVRRNPAGTGGHAPIEIDDLIIDLQRYLVTLKGKPISLTRREFQILRALAINYGQVLEHEQLLRHAWGSEYEGDKKQLWVYVSRLRKKLNLPNTDREYIHTRFGIGYMLR